MDEPVRGHEAAELSLEELCRRDPSWAAVTIERLELQIAAELGDGSKFDDWWCCGDHGGSWFLYDVPEPYIVTVTLQLDYVDFNQWRWWDWEVCEEHAPIHIKKGRANNALDAMEAAERAWREIKKSQAMETHTDV